MDDVTNEPYAERPHLSVSQITMYLRCSKQYFYRYIEGLKRPPNIRLVTGKAGHAGIEQDNLWKLTTGESLPARTIVEHGVAAFEEFAEEAEDATATEKSNAKDSLAATLDYYGTEYSPHAPKVLAAEQEFFIDVSTKTDPMLGYIDLIDADGIWDYKFTSRPKTQDEVDLSLQLSVYDIANGQKAKNLGLVAIIPATSRSTPRIAITRRTPALLRKRARTEKTLRTLTTIEAVSEAIQHETFIPVDDPRICSWCGYRDICQTRTTR